MLLLQLLLLLGILTVIIDGANGRRGHRHRQGARHPKNLNSSTSGHDVDNSIGVFSTPASFEAPYRSKEEREAIRTMNSEIRKILSDYEMGIVKSIKKKNRMLYRLLVKGRGIGDFQQLEYMKDWSKASQEAMTKRAPLVYAEMKAVVATRWKRTARTDLAGGHNDFGSGEHRPPGGGRGEAGGQRNNGAFLGRPLQGGFLE